MSKNRDKKQDRDKTRKLILQHDKQKTGDGKNWLGHKNESKAACLDEMLLNGASKPEMQKIRGAIDEHLWHLKNEHGLSIEIEDEIYKINRADLGISKEDKSKSV